MTRPEDAFTPEQAVAALKDRMLKRSFFVMFRKILDPARIPSLMLEHYRWVIDLEKRGAVFASGPLFKNEQGPGVGLTVFRAGSQAEAEGMAAGDPFCASGAASFEVQRWQINEGRLTVAIDFSDQTYRFD